MSDEPLLIEIVHALEEQGLARNEYQLQRVIDSKPSSNLWIQRPSRLISKPILGW